jgi:hypothetical protein
LFLCTLFDPLFFNFSFCVIKKLKQLDPVFIFESFVYFSFKKRKKRRFLKLGLVNFLFFFYFLNHKKFSFVFSGKYNFF